MSVTMEGGGEPIHKFLLITMAGKNTALEAQTWLAEKCADSSVSLMDGLVVVSFQRRSHSLLRAIVAAARDVHASGLFIKRIEPDYLVTLSEIARRLCVSRSAVAGYRKKASDDNSFSSSIARVSTNNALGLA